MSTAVEPTIAERFTAIIEQLLLCLESQLGSRFLPRRMEAAAYSCVRNFLQDIAASFAAMAARVAADNAAKAAALPAAAEQPCLAPSNPAPRPESPRKAAPSRFVSRRAASRRLPAVLRAGSAPQTRPVPCHNSARTMPRSSASHGTCLHQVAHPLVFLRKMDLLLPTPLHDLFVTI